MQENLRNQDIYTRTHEEIEEVRLRFMPSITEHSRRVHSSEVQRGLEVREIIREYVGTVRHELPDILSIRYGKERTSVDLNLNEWTFFFAGAQRPVDSSVLGDFWFENHGAILSAIESQVLQTRGIFLG